MKFINRLLLIAVIIFNYSFLKAQKSNILLIVSDDLNTRIGPYMDINNHTPNLDRLANEGVRFTRAYSQYPLCGPSRASFMSGLYPETNGVLGNDDQPGSYRKHTPSLSHHPSMAGFFREHGYFTARVSKIFHMGVPGGIERGDPGGDDPDSWDYAYNVMGPETLSPGNLELLSPGSLHYGGNFSRMVLADSLRFTQTDYIATSQAIAILENRAGKLPEGGTNKKKQKPEAPFFLAVGLVRPHVPLIAPENCFEHYPEKKVMLPQIAINDDVPEEALRRRNGKIWKMDEEQKKKVVSGYMASVRFMDQQVGRLLDALDRLQMRENTIVIFISDHGYNLGEHDCWSKVSLWEGSVRVPMIISHPGYPAGHGQAVGHITELIDLYPTLTDLCGFGEDQPEILQGRSQAQIVKWDQAKDLDADGRVAYTITYRGMGASIRTKRWRYTAWSSDAEDLKEELYDHSNDPEEIKNLALDPLLVEALEEMRTTMSRVREMAKKKVGDQ